VLKVTVEELGLESSRGASVPQPPDLMPLAGAIIVRGDRVLLTERRFPGHGEQWSWPSGKIEGSESLEDAIRRELLEELLIADAEVIEYMGTIDLPSGFRMSHFHVAIPQTPSPSSTITSSSCGRSG
jgi:ADP-ribose pyrophosphatase YjhB (NUDIX family)